MTNDPDIMHILKAYCLISYQAAQMFSQLCISFHNGTYPRKCDAFEVDYEEEWASMHF